MATAKKKSVAKKNVASEWLTPAAADKKANGRWFTGYAKQVRLAPVTEFDLDFDADAVEGGYVVFEGLSVGGLLRANFHRAIIAVVGDLHVGRLVLGDAVLVVTGKVIASEFVAVPMNEGVFSVQGQQQIEKIVKLVKAPWLLVADRCKRETRLFAAKGTSLVEVKPDAIDPSLLDDGELVYDRIFKRLTTKQSPL